MMPGLPMPEMGRSRSNLDRDSRRRARGRNRRRCVGRVLEVLEDRTLLSFTPISQPGDTVPGGIVYTTATSNLASDIPADGDTTTTLTDGTETITFSESMTAATAPDTWNNWGSPPDTESAAPRSCLRLPNPP
jgi:hypothetical protein